MPVQRDAAHLGRRPLRRARVLQDPPDGQFAGNLGHHPQPPTGDLPGLGPGSVANLPGPCGVRAGLRSRTPSRYLCRAARLDRRVLVLTNGETPHSRRPGEPSAATLTALPPISRSRNHGHPRPPPQIRKCGITASGSCVGWYLGLRGGFARELSGARRHTHPGLREEAQPEPCPVVVEFHGGSEGQAQPGVSTFAQLFVKPFRCTRPRRRPACPPS